MLVPHGPLVRSPLLHTGPARELVHLLKYQGLRAAARPLATAMRPLLDPAATALVPVPRSLARRWRYGVDPGPELAAVMAVLTGIPVVQALRAEMWHPRRAGGATANRGLPRFRTRLEVPAGAVLVDDVFTTGSTLRAASDALGGVAQALTATIAPSAIGAFRARAETGECR